MITPRISIIMATYNRAHLIETSLDSILNQTFKDWECIIIDDGSSDHTSVTIKSYIEKDDRLLYFKRSEEYVKGLSGCRNMGLDKARGDYYIFFDDDDIVHPQNLEINLSYLLTSKKTFCNYQKQPFYKKEPEILKLNGSIETEDFNTDHLESFVTGHRPIASCTVLWDKKCFDNNRFNENLHYAEEWECYGRILLSGFEGVSTDEVLYFNRKHPNSSTGKFDLGDPLRKKSMALATKQMIRNIAQTGFLTNSLELFFLRLGFKLNDREILKEIFKHTGPGIFKRIKYQGGIYLYPVIKPIFRFKAKLKRS